MRLPDHLADTLRGGGGVVTSSARAARALRRLYAQAQREQGRTAWRAPEIVDWDSWLERLWMQRLRSGGERRLLLSPVQEHETWVRLVRPAIEGRRLISIDGVVDLAEQAYALLCAYDARDFLRAETLSGDVDSFCEWARSFENECRQQGWLSRCLLPLELAQALRQAGAGGLELPPRVMLSGFDRVKPLEQRLIAALEYAGCAIEPAERSAQEITAGELVEAAGELVEANDASDEIASCAWWARRAIETAARENKQPHIAVIVPDAALVRPQLERIFRQVLAEQSIPIGGEEPPPPFEFSLGVPLTEVPSARAALLLLRWMEEALDRQELRWLLLSGFLWRAQEDLLPVASLDATIRKSGVLPLEFSLSAFLRRKGWSSHGALETLRDRLYAARRAWRENRTETLTFAQWAERAQRVLTAAGWPGPHRLRSEDFQAQRKWSLLLDAIAALAFDSRRVDSREFLRVLARQAGRTIFSPQSRGAPIEILGPFEAAGMAFDAVWFLRAHDARWPAPARPHPFLTRSLQRDRGMPHADFLADWEIATRVAERVRRSTPECVFSYARQDQEGARRPSTALGGALKQVSAAQMRERMGVTAADFEGAGEQEPLAIEVEDAAIVPWPGEQDAGGYGTLQMQAQCPFRAFATMRLGARELDLPDWGLDPAERGQLLHRALEGIWGELKDRETLINEKARGSLLGIVEAHVGQALARYGSRETGDGAEENEREKWGDAYLQAEGERVVKLIEEWLAYEERRSPFVVAQREQKLSANVGGLKLKLRADRVDEVDGGRLLIDYKTGDASPKAWEGERPDEVQLPLYAAYGKVPALRGVLLAEIRAGCVKLEGHIEELPAFPEPSRILPYSDQLRRQWQRVLLALGQQFLNGEAQVDPKQFPMTCTYCALPGLCRVAEMNLAEVETVNDALGGAEGGTDA